MRATPVKKSAVESYGGPRLLVVIGADQDPARAVEAACLLGQEAHADLMLACAPSDPPALRGQALERASQLARLHRLRVSTAQGPESASAADVLRLARRLRPRVLVLAVARPGPGWRGWRRALDLWRILRGAPCEVVVVRS